MRRLTTGMEITILWLCRKWCSKRSAAGTKSTNRLRSKYTKLTSRQTWETVMTRVLRRGWTPNRLATPRSKYSRRIQMGLQRMGRTTTPPKMQPQRKSCLSNQRTARKLKKMVKIPSLQSRTPEQADKNFRRSSMTAVNTGWIYTKRYCMSQK